MKKVLSLAIICLMAAPAVAQPVVDGQLDALYGPAKAEQLINTSFGDPTGSELDAGYAKLFNGRLYVMLAGNIEGNFNKLEVFIDSKAGGENSLSSTPLYDFSNEAANLAGLTFDSGFEADYHAFARHGGGSDFDFTFVDRQGGGNATVPGSGNRSGGNDTLPKTGGSFAANSESFWTNGGPTANPNGIIEGALDNSNVAGVGGAGGAVAATGDPLLVTTGLEFSVDLLDLGIDISSADPNFEIKISALVNGGNHGFLSNQTLGSIEVGETLPSGDHLGSPSGVNFANLGGLQYFTIALSEHMVPEPASMALLGMASIGMLCTRRRS